MRTREEAGETYFEIYRKSSQKIKKFLSAFEGTKIFRFGNSWKRKGVKGEEVVLPDSSNQLHFIGAYGRKKIFK